MRGTSHYIPRHFLDHINWCAPSAILALCISGFMLPSTAFGQATKPSPKAPPGAATSNPATKPLLKPGSQGAEVTELQALLKLMGYYSGTVNGVYDDGTASAVTSFQKAARLSPDGIVGAETWNRLLPPSPVVTANATPAPKPTTPTAADSFPAPAGIQPGGVPVSQPTPPKTSTPKPATPPAQTGGESAQAKGSESATFPVLRLGMKGPAVEGLQERLKSLGFLKGATDGVFGPETQAAVKAAQRRLSLEPDGVVGNSTWIGILR